MLSKARIAVLVSGGGTNLQAILDSIDNGNITNAEVAVVISNNAGVYALERAKQKRTRKLQSIDIMLVLMYNYRR